MPMNKTNIYFHKSSVNDSNELIFDYDALNNKMSKLNSPKDGYLVLVVNNLCNDVNHSVAWLLRKICDLYSELPFALITSNGTLSDSEIITGIRKLFTEKYLNIYEI